MAGATGGVTARVSLNIRPGVATATARMLRRRAALQAAVFSLVVRRSVTLMDVATALAPFALPVKRSASRAGRPPKADARATRLALLGLALADVRERGRSEHAALKIWIRWAGVGRDDAEAWRRAALRDRAELRATALSGRGTNALDVLEYAARATFPRDRRGIILEGKSRRR
jgi:hypothetical protein